jgi:predicted KAP-like P-loop ATPase
VALFLDLEFITQKNIWIHPVVFPGSESKSSSQGFVENLPHLENTIYMIHVDAIADEKGEFIEEISAPRVRYGASHFLVHKNWVDYPSEAISKSKNFQNGLVVAHDLAHDLIDSDYITESNNILTPFAHTWQITEQQCESVRRHPKVKSLILED